MYAEISFLDQWPDQHHYGFWSWSLTQWQQWRDTSMTQYSFFTLHLHQHHYNIVNFHQNTHKTSSFLCKNTQKRHLIAPHEGKVFGVFCKFKFWFAFSTRITMFYLILDDSQRYVIMCYIGLCNSGIFDHINTLRPRQIDCHFADDSLKCILLNENV